MATLGQKELIIVAGANGSGKTTFAIPYVKEKKFSFLNADEITKEFELKGMPNAMMKAGREFFKRLNDYISNDESFVVETTLSGSYINKVAQKAKKLGYRIRTIYIFLDDPQICVERVKYRVSKGGHDVPITDIIRRYFRSKQNFWSNFTELSDSWIMLYNADEGFMNVAIGQSADFEIINPYLFKLFHENLNNETS